MRRFDSDASSSSSPWCRKRRRSPSTSSASESTDGSESGLGVGVGKRSTGRSDLLLTTLSMFPGEESTCDDSYAENGKSKERIKHVLSGKVCNCSKDCRIAFTLTTIYNVCCTFWSLNKAAQDCILWGIQNMVESDGSKRGPASRGGSSCSSSSSESSTSEAESASSYSSCDPGKKHVNTWHIQGWLCRRLSLLTLLIMYVCHLLLSMLARIQVFKYAVKLFANCWELEVGGWSVRVGHFKGRVCESTVSCLSKSFKVHHTLKYSALCANCLKSDWQFLKVMWFLAQITLPHLSCPSSKRCIGVWGKRFPMSPLSMYIASGYLSFSVLPKLPP